jgi:ribonuclease-3
MPSTTSSRDSDPAPPAPLPLSARLGHPFRDPSLLELALRHRSWCSENGGAPSNERLEFLGDAVLGLVITERLFASSPDQSEGVLARWRAELVNAPTLAGLARSLRLGDDLLLGKGEESTGGRQKASILADSLEAVIGAVHLDGGIAASRALVLDLFEDRIDAVRAGGVTSDFKSRLQELAAHRFGELPRYRLSEQGPEHAKEFSAEVRLGGEVRGRGVGRTKKEAEQNAAQEAYEDLSSCPPGDGDIVSVPQNGDTDA